MQKIQIKEKIFSCLDLFFLFLLQTLIFVIDKSISSQIIDEVAYANADADLVKNVLPVVQKISGELKIYIDAAYSILLVLFMLSIFRSDFSRLLKSSLFFIFLMFWAFSFFSIH